MTDAAHAIEAIRDDFAFIDDWEERYRYVIDLGRKLPALAQNDYDERHKVRGCASQVWLVTELTDTAERGRVLRFRGDSDALIVKGLIAILFAIYSDKTPQEILQIDADAIFRDLGLTDHLTPQRSNGLASMNLRIRADAQAALDASPSSTIV